MDEDVAIPTWLFKTAAALLLLFAGLAVSFWLIETRPVEQADAPIISDRPTLIVFDNPSCHWCERFKRIIAPVYEGSRFDRLAPLRYVDIADGQIDIYHLNGKPAATPTFVLVDRRGREVGRIRGYPGGGPAEFLAEVERMLAKVQPEPI